MADSDNMESKDETQDEGVTQEQETVEDTDADTRDVERTETEESSAVMERLSRLEKMMSTIEGSIQALRDAQSVFVENGATIMETEPEDNITTVDGFVNPSELNLLID